MVKPDLLALAVLVLVSGPGSVVAQTVPIPAPQEPAPVRLDDVTVMGPRLEQAARAYVGTVGAAPDEREPAAWRSPICVGVGGMAAEPARALADRVSDWGHSLGLTIARPGCTPNIVIVATGDGDATARALVAARPREFRTRVSDTDRGGAALREFQRSGRPVRWWHVSVPMNEQTGRAAVRMPGYVFGVAGGIITSPRDLGVVGSPVTASRIMGDPVRDDLQQVVIVLESSALDRAGFDQIADYVSMAALAQIDPEASPEVPSILHLFDDDQSAEPTLTRWDQAYLRALYGAHLGGASRNVNRSILARAVAGEMRSDTEPAPGDDPRP